MRGRDDVRGRDDEDDYAMKRSMAWLLMIGLLLASVFCFLGLCVLLS